MIYSIEEGLRDFRQGKFLIVLDDENRENEGDLIVAAEMISSEKVNFMIKHARGLVCLPILEERLGELEIGPMVDCQDPDEAAFTVSIDHKDSGTGVSAKARANTIRRVLDREAGPEDFLRPGHLFPLRARPGGVLERMGHTEAAVDLARLAGFYPAGVLCEIINDDGTMARYEDLVHYSRQHDIKIITIEDLRDYIIRGQELKELEAGILV